MRWISACKRVQAQKRKAEYLSTIPGYWVLRMDAERKTPGKGGDST
jgi:hypothetical protein